MSTLSVKERAKLFSGTAAPTPKSWATRPASTNIFPIAKKAVNSSGLCHPGLLSVSSYGDPLCVVSGTRSISCFLRRTTESCVGDRGWSWRRSDSLRCGVVTGGGSSASRRSCGLRSSYLSVSTPVICVCCNRSHRRTQLQIRCPARCVPVSSATLQPPSSHDCSFVRWAAVCIGA